MKKGLLILFLFSILCLYLLPFCLCETNFTTKADDHDKQLKQGRPRKGSTDLQGSEELHGGAAVVTVMRAKAVYGGANDIHHGRSKNDANSLRIKSISSLVWKVSFGFLGFCLIVKECKDVWDI
uniref:Transmembrane protein n=1 Tax=Cucumis melo TaxID=3656 RepID=A0A9I9CY80_CUCME